MSMQSTMEVILADFTRCVDGDRGCPQASNCGRTSSVYNATRVTLIRFLNVAMQSNRPCEFYLPMSREVTREREQKHPG